MSAIIPGELPALTINLEYGDGEHAECTKLPWDLYAKFTGPNKGFPEYGFMEVNVSVRVLTDDGEADWFDLPESKWMRQKIRRAVKLGYEFRAFEHDEFLDDVHEINTSMGERQGKEMSASYVARPASEPSSAGQTCAQHRRDWFGVFKDGKLYAYANVLQCGEMMLYSRILGHGEFMDDGIMNLLVFEAAKRRHEQSGTKYAVYFLQHSGTEGLQFFKRKMGFSGHLVAWEIARPGVTTPPVPVRAKPAAVSTSRKAYRALINRVPAVKTVAKKLKG